MKRPAEGGFVQVVSKRMTSTLKTNREQDTPKTQLCAIASAIDVNPIYTTRELSKIFHVSRHMAIYR
ncbi:unnamed protein product [Hymenolepis diminuta]|uniref:Uncharacterized protein n=1 Tax=Hymenolepis diminuta TaxID=6216 RepID=A0A564YL65_HYMDI|nr:unnamed protein product [Hymenolepis diminuta]